jgi:hypothetical protein
MTFPAELVRSIAEGRCVLFVGSGLSKHTHDLPTWNEFIKRLRSNLAEYHGDEVDASGENLESYPLEYLEYLKENFGPQYQAALQEELEVRVGGPIQRAHELIVDLPWAAIITTNLDTLLEQAFESEQRDYVIVDTEESLANVGIADGTLVLKMHGSVRDSDSQVLTRFEYLEFDRKRHAMKALVLSLFTQFPTLVIGAGVTDPNFLKIYGIAHSAMLRFKHKAFYVGSGLPRFVQKVWANRKLEYIEVPHKGLTPWLTELKGRVVTARSGQLGRRPSAFVNHYLKEAALLSLAEMLHDYRALQQRYLDQVHIPDYGWFTEPWDKSLYGRLRSAVQRAVEELRSEGDSHLAMLYIAPGPHAPLFSDEGARRWAARNVNRLALMDILSSVVFAAESNLKGQLDGQIEIKPFIVDLTGGCGDALCNVLHELIREDSPEQVLKGIEETEMLLERVLGAEHIPQVIASVIQAVRAAGFLEPADVTYSEMVASFMATPPLMAFRSALYAKFAPLAEGADWFEQIMDRAERLWRVFNDRAYILHVGIMRELTRPGGLILVALDVEKRFTEPGTTSINSFSTAEPQVPSEWLLERDQRFEADTMWRDHEHGFSVRVAGITIRDFLPHEHRVKMYAYTKR